MKSDVHALLQRAKKDIPAPPPRKENRYVYGGSNTVPGETPAYRPNRRVTRSRFSTFNTMIVLFSFGIVIVLYINNVITVDHLAAEIGRRQAVYDAQLSANASLRAEVNKKAAWERIGKTATEQLGLVFSTEQPVQIAIDKDARSRTEKR